MSEDYASIDYQMSILQAAKEGKHIEINGRALGRPLGAWVERADTVLPFNFASNCYRVKPKPVELEVWYNPTPPAGFRVGYADAAPETEYLQGEGYTKIKMRQVLD